jgi:hypothetical protein
MEDVMSEIPTITCDLCKRKVTEWELDAIDGFVCSDCAEAEREEYWYALEEQPYYEWDDDWDS